MVAADYGLSDKFAYLAAAIDPTSGTVYFYKNKTTRDKSIEDLAKMYYDFVDDVPSGGFYTAPLLDPKSGAKRDYDKKTLYDHFLDYGIYFQPGHIQIDARIFRVNTYLESGKAKIMDCCDELIQEIQNYKFPERVLGSNYVSDKPIDKDNHSINPMEWILMALPADPRTLSLGSYNANRYESPEELRKRAAADRSWQLSDPSEAENDEPFVFSLY